jgi:hypothetical protein
MENGGPLSLTAEEHAGLIQYLSLKNEMEDTALFLDN